MYKLSSIQCVAPFTISLCTLSFSSSSLRFSVRATSSRCVLLFFLSHRFFLSIFNCYFMAFSAIFNHGTKWFSLTETLIDAPKWVFAYPLWFCYLFTFKIWFLMLSWGWIWISHNHMCKLMASLLMLLTLNWFFLFFWCVFLRVGNFLFNFNFYFV